MRATAARTDHGKGKGGHGGGGKAGGGFRQGGGGKVGGGGGAKGYGRRATSQPARNSAYVRPTLPFFDLLALLPAWLFRPPSSDGGGIGPQAKVAEELEKCLLIQHPRAKEDLSNASGGADAWNSHSPDTEIIETRIGAKVFLGAIEGATAAAGFNLDEIGLVVDARGEHCAGQNVRGQYSASPSEYRSCGVDHCFLEVNKHMKRPRLGDNWVINNLPSLCAHLVVVLNCLAVGMSVQYHCISPLFPPHRFHPPGSIFDCQIAPPLPK